jgi:putative endonuclease
MVGLMWYIYMLKSRAKEWYYVGSTNDLSRRLAEHNNGKVTSTKAFVPYDVVHTESFEEESSARLREREIKQRRILKEEIVRRLQ